MQSVSSQDRAAWQRLVRIYSPLIYSWARRNGLQESDAADVTQDVMLSVWANLGQFDKSKEGSSFRAWLRTICKNKILDFYRKNGKQPPGRGGTTANLKIHELPVEEFLEEEKLTANMDVGQMHRQTLENAKGMFKEQVWVSFWRTAIEGDKPEDVAEDLGVSVWAVYKARARVLQRLRKELEGLY